MDMPLYPFESRTRRTRDLSGLWTLRLDAADEGEALGWQAGVDGARPIAVPGSWNESFDDARDHFGIAWYQLDFSADAATSDERTWLRVGSANYHARAWLNGTLLGEHTGGHLPFVFEVSEALRPGERNRLVIRVDNTLATDRVPAAAEPGVTNALGTFPAVTFDFFPHGGLLRPVLLFTTPRVFLRDLAVRTGFDGDAGVVGVEAAIVAQRAVTVRLELRDGERVIDAARSAPTRERAEAALRIPRVRPWCPDDPHLYRLCIVLEGDGGECLDVYALPVGVRTVAVRGDALLLNDEPILLRGFGRHEDAPLHGRALDLPTLLRDLERLKWIGANSFRTAHYPHADEALQLADRLGLLVIAETPAVSLPFTDAEPAIAAREAQTQRALAEMIARDRNHPSVVLWSVANEPGVAEAGSIGGNAAAISRGTRFFAGLFAAARAQDATRPVVLVGFANGPDEWVGQGDIVCVNLYHGWYYAGPGQLRAVAEPALERELLRLRARHGKPLMLTEFGADALPGLHAEPSQLWSEEYQAEMIEMYLDVAARHPWIVGTHPWAFADFRTAQGITRVGGLNHKGVFTRDREPKLAAHRLRERWRKS